MQIKLKPKGFINDRSHYLISEQDAGISLVFDTDKLLQFFDFPPASTIHMILSPEKLPESYELRIDKFTSAARFTLGGYPFYIFGYGRIQTIDYFKSLGVRRFYLQVQYDSN